MKRYFGKALFGLLLWLFVFGATLTIPVLHAGTSGITVTAKVLAVPQAGSTPVGLPNGTAHQVAVSWTASTPVSGVTVAGYNVFRSTSAGGEAGALALNGATPVSGTSFVDSTAVAGTTYFYVVSAQSSTGNQSGFSNEASATVPANPSNPTGCKTAAQ